jgi:hypothetical protein
MLYGGQNDPFAVINVERPFNYELLANWFSEISGFRTRHYMQRSSTHAQIIERKWQLKSVSETSLRQLTVNILNENSRRLAGLREIQFFQ